MLAKLSIFGSFFCVLVTTIVTIFLVVTILQKHFNFVDCVQQITFVHRVIPKVHIITSRMAKHNHPNIFINTCLPCNLFCCPSHVDSNQGS